MNQDELKELKVILIYNAEYYGRRLSDVVLKMMAQDLQDLPLEKVKKAFDLFRHDPKTVVMPLPAAVRARITGSPTTSQEQALDFTARLIRAIRAHGENWTKGYPGEHGRFYFGRGKNQFLSFEEAVADEFGQLANFALHFIAENRWHSLCEKFHMIGEGMFTAQIRELSSAMLKRLPDQNLEPAKSLTAAEQKGLPEGIKKLMGPIKGIA